MYEKKATGCYRELGAELRKIRHAAGKTEAEVGEWLGCSTAWVSRAERGFVPLNVIEVVSFLAYCGVYHSDQRTNLMALCREAEPRLGHWIRRHGAAGSLRSLVYHESTASVSTSYEPIFVPGLLQTEGYIRALTMQRWSQWDADLVVRVRQQRQQILHLTSPSSFTFFVHENALRLKLGDAKVMRDQVLELLFLDGLPHLSIRVVPAAAGAKAMVGGPFRLFEYIPYQPLVYLDGPRSGLFLEDREYVDDYRALLPGIANAALDEGGSRECLADLANQYDRENADRDDQHHVEEGSHSDSPTSD